MIKKIIKVAPYAGRVYLDGDEFTIPAEIPTRNGYKFLGWHAKRVDDNSWYVSGRGFMTEDQLNQGYSPLLFKPGQLVVLSSLWTAGTPTT